MSKQQIKHGDDGELLDDAFIPSTSLENDHEPNRDSLFTTVLITILSTIIIISLICIALTAFANWLFPHNFGR